MVKEVLASKEDLEKAIEEAIKSEKKGFLQSVELIVVFKGIDMKSGEVKFRDTVFLPNKISKERKVCVITDSDMLEKVKAANPATILIREELLKLQGNKKLIKKIASSNDWFLVRQDLLGNAGRILGPALGPRGKFPIPYPQNADVSSLISRYKNSTLLKTKDQPHIQTLVGTEDMEPKKIAENCLAVLEVIEGKVKAQNLRAIYVKKTMGKPIKVV